MTNQNSEEIKVQNETLIDENITVENTQVEETMLKEETNEPATEVQAQEDISEKAVANNETGENTPLVENNEELPETKIEPVAEPVTLVTSPELLDSENDMFDENIDEEEFGSENTPEIETIDYATLTNDEILAKLKNLIHEINVETSRTDIELLKTQFYKNQKKQFELLKKELKEKAGDADVEIEMPKDPNEDYLKELLNDYRKKKAEAAQKQEAEKQDNLNKKLEIIEKIKVLANSEESLNKTYADFKDLQKQWLEIGTVPSSEASGLWKSYQLQIERFYDFVKISNELRDLDFKKNLEQKLELCEKAESLLIESDIVAAYKKLQELHNLWKELGPVPSDKREEIWDRFSETSKKIRQSYQEHFEKLKEERETNYQQKIILCEKVETIVNENLPQSGKEWTEISDQIVEIQKLWKTIGMVPNKVNTEIYERFRNSCNKFFDLKKEFYSHINEELNTNLQKKIELCVSAESIKDSTDWKKTTEMFLDLQKKWKEIGPAPKKNSEQVWQRFRAACNHFFDAKSNFFANITTEYKENQIKKEELIAEINNYQASENQAENIDNLKTFQTRWTEIGFVSHSEKERLYAEYKTAINGAYAKLNLSRSNVEISNFNSKINNLKDSGSIAPLGKERNKIIQKIKDMESEIIQIENNMGFFSAGSDSLIKDFKKKIEKIQSEIKILKEKKKSIDLAERDLKQKEEEKNNSDEKND
ncbi:DUF349 domain-containing protein [Bacteroidales bacterium OttesenSCG-928-I21]|nr:DUF349 domain-containing protein [Bacteroidales bacterium OttesenSCG-928-I21]